MLWSLTHRTDFEFNILPDRNPLFVTLSDGGLRNGYTVKISNKLETARHFKIRLAGLQDARAQYVGFETSNPVIDVGPAEVRALRFYVSLSPSARSQLKGALTPIVMTVVEDATGHESARPTSFKGPGQ